MALKQIEAHNFKSFRDLSVELGQLNVLIGANASGKSNFVQLLRFARDITNAGLENAISLQGGSDYLLNLLLGYSEPFRLRMSFTEFLPFVMRFPSGQVVDAESDEFSYGFTLTSSESDGKLHIARDELQFASRFYLDSAHVSPVPEPMATGHLIIANDDGEVTYSITSPASDYVAASTPPRSLKQKVRHHGLMLEQFFEYFAAVTILPPLALTILVPGLTVYDFIAKLPKGGAQLAGKADLEEDGRNLVISLKKILEDENERRTFSNLLQDILPFVADIDVQRFADRFQHFRLRETYSGQQFLPSSLLSDGTVNIIALIVALYFTDKPLIVIEEPEKNIHPYLIARVANMLKDASRHKQIIVTTHNPEIVRNVALDDLLLVSRDRDGFSAIRRPAEDHDVQTFLSNEIGIEELFARNLLGT